MNPGGGAGWDEPPLDIQIPDDARELDRDVLAYRRELRAMRRRNWRHRLAGPLGGHGTLMPLLASILAVCLVAGAMLSVATFSPAPSIPRPSRTPPAPATSRTHPVTSAPVTPAPGTSAPGTSAPGTSAPVTSAEATVTASPARVRVPGLAQLHSFASQPVVSGRPGSSGGALGTGSP